MKMLFTQRAKKWMLALMACSLLSLRAHTDVHPYVSDKEQDRLAGLRYAALHGDRSKIPDLIQALHGPSGTHIGTALHGLEHLQAMEALPDIEEFIQQQQPSYDREAARVVRARLIAEANTATLQTQASFQSQQAKPLKTNPGQATVVTSPANSANLQIAHAKVQRFLQEMNLDMNKIKAGVAAYNLAKTKGDVEWTAEVCALNELADMAYDGDYAAYSTLPELKGLETSTIPGVAVKMKYAAIPKSQRAQRMVDDMAKTGAQGLTLQLAIDEGLPASRYAARKLMEMDKNRNQYAIELGGQTYYHAGFASLFRLIAGVGDKEQLPVIEHFLNDRDGYINYYAHQVLGQVKLGMRKQWVSGN